MPKIMYMDKTGEYMHKTDFMIIRHGQQQTYEL